MIRCISCMSEYNETASPCCPVCGFDHSGYRHDPAALNPGTLVGGRYMIGKRVDYDRCGYSINYAAWDTQTGSRVSVVEFYPREFVARDQATGALTVSRQDLIGKLDVGKKSFIMEAMKLKKLNEINPKILRVYDSFAEKNTAYMVTEYLEGQTLEQYVSANKKMSYPEVAATFREVLGTLSDIHAGGIIHKYICPKNIFLTNDGRVVLINFGAFRSGIAESSSSVASTLEIGFAPYEQYSSTRQQGKSVDIYAVGACMYYALTGLRPPAAPDRVDQDTLVPINKAAKGVPNNTAYIIMNALNMKPENRPRQISEFIHAIEGKGRVVRKKEKLKKEKVSLPKWLIPVMALIALAFTGFFLWNNRNDVEIIDVPNGMTQVPSVSGQSLDEAVNTLSEAGLSMIISGRVYDDYLEINTVLRQTPHPGSLAYSGSTVEVIASAPSQRIQVPNVTGMSRDAAKASLEEAGLTAGFVDVEDDTALLDTVVQQSIEPQTEVLAGTEVILSVNVKNNNIEIDPDIVIPVPSLVNLTFEEAAALILSQKLNMVVDNYAYSNTVPKGCIISQNIQPDTQAAQGEVVRVVISNGPEVILAPNLQYVSESQARSILSGTGLNLNVYFENSSSVSEGLIIRQSPAANTPLNPGAYIDVYISSGNPVTVPNVIGSSQLDAQNAIRAAGLSCSFSYENSEVAPAGQVIAQSVPSGTQLEYGATVVVTISSGSRTVSVTGVSLNSSTLSMKKNTSATLYASVTPSNATNTSVTWTSSDSSVAEVTSGGIVTARGTGSAVITVTTNSGNYQDSCTVTVTANTAWSGWSEWSETYPDGHGEIESMTQYRLVTTEYAESTSSSMSGYSLRSDITNPQVTYGTAYYSDTYVASSATLDVEAETYLSFTGAKKYKYWGYYSPNCSESTPSKPYTHFCKTCGERDFGGDWYYQELILDQPLTPLSGWSQHCKHMGTAKKYRNNGYSYYWVSEEDAPAETKTRYRCTPKSTTYYFEKTTDTGWVSEAIPGAQTRTLYRYRDLVEIS